MKIVVFLLLIWKALAFPLDEENFLSNPNLAPVEEDKKIAINLYPPEDGVQVLTADSFKTKVENSTSAWLVQFYSSWNSECEDFAPVWKSFSEEVSSWNGLVQLAVIACSDEINAQICEDYRIVAYPTVKYFHEDYQTSPEDLGVVLSLNETAEDSESLRHHLIDTIIEEIGRGRGDIYPDLAPYNHSVISQLYDIVPDTALYAFLVVVEPESYLGVEMILDFYNYTKLSVLYAYSNNTELIKGLPIDDDEFPKVLVFGCCDNKPRILEGKFEDRWLLKHGIMTFLHGKGVKIDDDKKYLKSKS